MIRAGCAILSAMPFIKLSHVKTTEPTAADFFVNTKYITRITSRDGGATLFMHDGTTVVVQQSPDTIADYVNQVDATRGSAEIKVRRE